MPTDPEFDPDLPPPADDLDAGREPTRSRRCDDCGRTIGLLFGAMLAHTLPDGTSCDSGLGRGE